MLIFLTDFLPLVNHHSLNHQFGEDVFLFLPSIEDVVETVQDISCPGPTTEPTPKKT